MWIEARPAEIVAASTLISPDTHSLLGSWWFCLVLVSVYTVGIFKTAYSENARSVFEPSNRRPIFRTVLAHSAFLFLLVCVVRGVYGTNLTHHTFGRGTLADIIVFAFLFVVGRVEIEWLSRNKRRKQTL